MYGGKTYKVFGKNAVNKLILYIETRIKKEIYYLWFNTAYCQK